MSEIKKYNLKYDKRVLFNLIVNGSQFQKVMDNLENKNMKILFKIYSFTVWIYKNIKI